MKRLNKQLLEKADSVPDDVEIGPLYDMPERIIQFGEGNFLRAFVDWMVNEMNKQGLFCGKAVIVQPIPQGLVDVLNEQDGLYTLLLRGIQDGRLVEKREIITSVSRGINPYTNWDGFLECAANPDLRFIISNTTEAGIAYVREDMPVNECPVSFPAKITAFLYERYKRFDGQHDKGMVIIPCELIDRNGDTLKEVVLRYTREWGLGDRFRTWLENSNYFLNTLVDRIVPGYPKEDAQHISAQLGYHDKLLDTGEIFHLWVIEGDRSFAEELPFDKAGLNVVWTDDMQPYRTRKVRILNGTHTMMVSGAYLSGLDTVGESVEDPVIGTFINRGLFDEIVPTLDLPRQEKEGFAADTLERFKNPFIRHYLLSVALNSVSKWKVRVLPSLLEYLSYRNELPKVLTFSLAALIAFYRGTNFRGETLLGTRDGETYKIQDDMENLKFFADEWKRFENHGDVNELCGKVLGNKAFWERDLNHIAGLKDAVAGYLDDILKLGMKAAVSKLIHNGYKNI
ncbi:MAG: tagaturonate reductase [Clostridiales bacterium]|nr:tagaturonate reductase [Clostridiales bacterium]